MVRTPEGFTIEHTLVLTQGLNEGRTHIKWPYKSFVTLELVEDLRTWGYVEALRLTETGKRMSNLLAS